MAGFIQRDCNCLFAVFDRLSTASRVDRAGLKFFHHFGNFGPACCAGSWRFAGSHQSSLFWEQPNLFCSTYDARGDGSGTRKNPGLITATEIFQPPPVEAHWELGNSTLEEVKGPR